MLLLLQCFMLRAAVEIERIKVFAAAQPRKKAYAVGL
jgi:hypothetical protein